MRQQSESKVNTLELKSGYIKQFLRDKQVASIMPSSNFSVRYIKRKINFKKSKVIVEYGPGTGVFSEMLLKNLKADAKLILFETNPDFTKILNEKFGKDHRVHIVKESALKVTNVLHRLKIKEVDYVITGIPFTFLTPKQRLKLIDRSHQVLKKGGKLISYQFSLTVNKYVKRQFDKFNISVQPLNIPPLLIIEGIK